MNEYNANLIAQIKEKRTELELTSDLLESVKAEVREMHTRQIARIVMDIDAIADAGVNTSASTTWCVYYGEGEEDYRTYDAQIVMNMVNGWIRWDICLTDENEVDTWLPLDVNEVMRGENTQMYLHLYEDWDFLLEKIILVTRDEVDDITAETYAEWRQWRKDRRALLKIVRNLEK